MTAFADIQEAMQFVQHNGIRLVDLKFADLWGQWRHVTISAREFNERLMQDGVGFDGSSVGFKRVEAGDMVLVPDLATGWVDPFCETPTLSFICRIVDATTREDFRWDPRSIAAKAEAYLKQTGIADESRWGPELEFYVFDRVAIHNEPHRSGFEIDAEEAHWRTGEAGLGLGLPKHGGYHVAPPQDALNDLRSEVSVLLEEAGVPVKYHHHEVGGAGQCEVEVPMDGLVRSGDVVMMVKYFVRNVARRRGKTVTFMPKPLVGEAGNGMHFHQHLFKGGRPLFYDERGYAGLSRLALSYVAGLLSHGAALSGLVNPSSNSYRRLTPGYEAPVSLFFSLGNRSAAIRVPEYATTPETKRIEYRPPDATCNVYLALAAQLMAGIRGIRRNLDPSAEGFGPYEDNFFALTGEEKARIRALPASLEEALDALDAEHDFLLEGDVFPEDLIAFWTRHKRETDVREIQKRPHPYEMVLYYNT
ncbi:MAG: type I glutamate--ammonia ligase [Chloroflexi bacterium]|nr:type I glutamate--ammonia ligase [Chloroflexota bacterium]